MMLAEVKNGLNYRPCAREGLTRAYRVFSNVSGSSEPHHMADASYVPDAKLSRRFALFVKRLELEHRVCLGIGLTGQPSKSCRQTQR